MIRKTHKLTCIKALISAPPNPIFSLVRNHPDKLPFWYTQTQSYVQVSMKWKKDPFFDSIEHIHKSTELKCIHSLKNFIARNPNSCIPISDVSKKGLQFDLKIKVARYLRQYPSIFEEFVGPQHNLPWFRLTHKAAEIDREEMSLLEVHQEDLKERLKKFILMSKEKALPLKIIKGLGWYLGWSDDMLQKLDDGSFRLVELEGGFKGLAVESHGRVLSVLQKNGMKRGVYSGEPMEALEFPLFPSKGLRLKKKIADWLIEFQKLPYVSPYEDYSYLDTDSDIAEKRVVGFLHELLCLFVEHSAERKKLLCLKKYFGLPQKVHKAFERHPHLFYLSYRNKTRTAILKEAYRQELAIEKHPLVSVRQKYIELMMESDSILKRRRTSNQVETVDHGTSEA
ncbi:Protein WHAT'S THIS FACTOR 9, mitochondrial [Linum perenne]